jgi:hypothetical protein
MLWEVHYIRSLAANTCNKILLGKCPDIVEQEIYNNEKQNFSVFVTCFHAGMLFGLSFDPEDRGDMFLHNVRWLSTDYMAIQEDSKSK